MWQNNPDHFQQPTPRPTMRTQCHLRSEIWGTWERTLLRSLTNRQSKVKRLHPNIHSSRMGTMTRASSVMRMQHTVKFLLKSGELGGNPWFRRPNSATRWVASGPFGYRLFPSQPGLRGHEQDPNPIKSWSSAPSEASNLSNCAARSLLWWGNPSTNIPPNILGCESSAALRLFTKTKLNALKKKRAHGGTGQNKTRFY